MTIDWIDVEDKLPEIGVNVYVRVAFYESNGNILRHTIGYLNRFSKFNIENDSIKVIYWKPLNPF